MNKHFTNQNISANAVVKGVSRKLNMNCEVFGIGGYTQKEIKYTLSVSDRKDEYMFGIINIDRSIFGGIMHFTDAKGILTGNGGRQGMNIYRGCTHGCIYCDSRSNCYQFTHPFEDIEVKQNAPELLEKALRSKRKKCMIGTGAMSDPYMHCESELHLMRRCLEIIRDNGFGVAVQTKSDRILEDIDLLDEINRKTKCVVQVTLTTFDDDLCSVIEPHVCNTKRRIEVLEAMKERGIPTVVWLTPILPFINDTEDNIISILNECVRVGVKGIICFDMGVTLRDGDREYFYAALDKHFPGLKQRYIERYGNRYELSSPDSPRLMKIFRKICKDNGIMYDPDECFAYLNEFPEKYKQISIFDC